MNRFTIVCILAIIYGVAGWTYDDFGSWPGLCQTGQAQSPINIVQKLLRRKLTQPIQYYNYGRLHQANIQNTGHTVQIEFTDQDKFPITLSNGILDGKYILENIHFHWGSEHTVNGRRYPLESHFVSYLRNAGNLTEALKIKNGVVVQAVFYEITQKDTTAFAFLTKYIKNIAKNINTPVNLKPFSPRTLLPMNIANVYEYSGSLTTPDCNEGVKWIIFAASSKIKQTELDALKDIYTEDGTKLTKSYRPVQKLNGREVSYVTFK